MLAHASIYLRAAVGKLEGSEACLAKQAILVGMATVEPLSPTEEALWRAVMRIVKVIPRHLDSDLIRGAGLTASEYTTIMHLSEAPSRELRMADLANATDLSASLMTRLVDDLQFGWLRDEDGKLLRRTWQRCERLTPRAWQN